MKTVRALAVAAVAAGITMAAAYDAGIRWNTSPSMPMGLWQVQPLDGPASRGEVVTLCLGQAPANLGVERGYLTGGECPGGIELLIKPVVAIGGDRVDVSPAGIMVNGELIPHSAALPLDDMGRAIGAVREGTYQVGPDEVWVISTCDPRSYDSRYYGAVPVANIQGQARPLFVKQGE